MKTISLEVIDCSANAITSTSYSSVEYYLETDAVSLGIPSWTASIESCGSLEYSLTVNGSDYTTYSSLFPSSDAFNTNTGEITLYSTDDSMAYSHTFILRATVRSVYSETEFTVTYLKECVETIIAPTQTA